jgi:hypothetical protein
MTTEPLYDYLGDGVYAFHDGYSIGLSLGHHLNEPLVWLEPEVLTALNRFATRAQDHYTQLSTQVND